MNTVTQDLLVELFSYEGEITLMKDGDEGLFHAIVPYRQRKIDRWSSFAPHSNLHSLTLAPSCASLSATKPNSHLKEEESK